MSQHQSPRHARLLEPDAMFEALRSDFDLRAVRMPRLDAAGLTTTNIIRANPTALVLCRGDIFQVFSKAISSQNVAKIRVNSNLSLMQICTHHKATVAVQLEDRAMKSFLDSFATDDGLKLFELDPEELGTVSGEYCRGARVHVSIEQVADKESVGVYDFYPTTENGEK